MGQRAVHLLTAGHLFRKKLLRPGGRRFRRQCNIAQNDRDLVAIQHIGPATAPSGCGGMDRQPEDWVERAGYDILGQGNALAVGHPVVVDQAGGKAVNRVLANPA